MTCLPWQIARVAILFLCLAAPAAQAADVLSPCRIAGIRNEVQCGSVTRPLDPARPGGTTIDVRYVVVPALARRKLSDAVFILAGGPGQSAIGIASSVLPLFTRLNNRRDIVFVDQRGTGRSAPLGCDEKRNLPLAEQIDPQRQFMLLMACRDKLQSLPYGDLRFFTTEIATQDLDAVRQQLSLDRINLVGVSYGTRVALDYVRQFPRAVRRIVNDGVAPPDMVLPASVSIDGQAAFDAMLDACAKDAACAHAHPALRAEWAALLAGLPRRVTVAHPLTGEPETFALTREMVLAAVRGPLYAPALVAALPFALSEAARGRLEPLMGLSSLLDSRKSMTPAMGMHYSVVCSEDLPRMSKGKNVSSGEFGSDFVRQYERVCASWPRGEVSAAFYALTASPSPVLLMSGAADPVTPPRHGARAAASLGSNAIHVVVPHAGHGVMGIGCMRDVMFRFVDAPSDEQALAVNSDCAKNLPPPRLYEPLRLSGDAAK